MNNQPINLFKLLNINENVVFYDETISNFFNYLNNNITEPNILTLSELSEVATLKRTNNWQTKEELQNTVQNIDKTYPKLFSYNDTNLKTFQQELQQITVLEEKFENLLLSRKNNANNLKRKISTLDTKLVELKHLEEKLSKYGEEKIKVLQELQFNNQNEMNDIEQLFSKPSFNAKFIGNFNLQEFSVPCQEFIRYCDLYIKSNFEVENRIDSISEDKIDKYYKESSLIQSRIFKTQMNLFKERMELYAKRNTLLKFPQTILETDITTMKFQTINLKKKLQQASTFLDSQMLELEKIALVLAEKKVENFNININKIDRARTRYENIQQVLNASTVCVNVSEIVWLLMQIDNLQMENFINLLKEEKNNESNELCWRRITTMRQLIRDPLDIFDAFLNNIIMDGRSLSEFSTETIVTYKDFVKQNAIFKNQILKLLNSLYNKKQITNLNDTLQQLNDKSETLTSIITEGPFSKPQKYDPYIFDKLQKSKQKITKAEEKTKDIRSKYNIFLNKLSDNLFRYGHLLWIYFLTQPKKMIGAIEEAKKQANKKLISNKNISAMLRDPNN